MSRTQLEISASAALDTLSEMGSYPDCPVEAELRAALDAEADRVRPSAHDLRVMAAALETPEDLTPRELGQAQADIITFLLAEADR